MNELLQLNVTDDGREYLHAIPNTDGAAQDNITIDSQPFMVSHLEVRGADGVCHLLSAKGMGGKEMRRRATVAADLFSSMIEQDD